MKELYPDVEIVSLQHAQSDINRAITIATDVMTANPDLAGIFANNDMTTIGATTAIKDRNMGGKLVLVGFDSCEENVAALEAGILNGWVAQNPFLMGYQAVEAAVDYLLGKPVEKNVETDTTFVTIDNYKDPAVEALLYPFGKNK